MFKQLLSFLLALLFVAQYVRSIAFQDLQDYYRERVDILKLCTSSKISYEKCIHTVAAARNNSIALRLDCIRRDNRESCISSVHNGTSDMLVLTGHGYKAARSAALQPVIFGKESDKSLYIAVAPRNFTFNGIQGAAIYFNHSLHRAFHAAAFFNFRMGHDICSFPNRVSPTYYISIVDAAAYGQRPDQIIICPTRLADEFKNYKACNVEAGLQRAVFTKSNITAGKKRGVLKIFETIMKHFNATSKSFNFFNKFQGEDDVIFKGNTISFDIVPTYRNEVNEDIFNKLHCEKYHQPHDPRVFL